MSTTIGEGGEKGGENREKRYKQRNPKDVFFFFIFFGFLQRGRGRWLFFLDKNFLQKKIKY